MSHPYKWEALKALRFRCFFFISGKRKTGLGQQKVNKLVQIPLVSLLYHAALLEGLNPSKAERAAERAADFLSRLKDCPLDFCCMFTLLITTGIRRGELLGLQWRDFDFGHLTVDIQGNVTYIPKSGVVVDTPKTENSMRMVPVIPSVAEL